MKSIVVIGSVNIDLVCHTPHIPAAGETILGSDLQQIPGGKGANQAVAAARLADKQTTVHMIGRVGDDGFGAMMRSNLEREGIDVTHVSFTPGLASGCALILVDDRGDNSITVAPGANSRLTPDDIDAARRSYSIGQLCRHAVGSSVKHHPAHDRNLPPIRRVRDSRSRAGAGRWISR